MSLTTANSKPLAPSEISDLIVKPVFDQAVAAQAATVLTFSTHDLRVPIISDSSASFVAEGNEIPISEPDLDELVITPVKLANLVPLTSELVADANGDITQLVGDSVTRGIARKIDTAFFSATTLPGGFPSIGSVTDTLTAASNLANLDVIVFAISELAAHGNQATTVAVSPATFRKLAMLKAGPSSNVSLLQPVATESTALRVAGLPVVVSNAIPDDTAWVVDSSRLVLAVRTSDVEVEVDSSVMFASDRLALRAKIRVGAGFPDPTALVKISIL